MKERKISFLGSSASRGHSPVAWGDFLSVCLTICLFVLSQGQPARPEAHPARPEAQPASPQAEPAKPETQLARPEAELARPGAQAWMQYDDLRHVLVVFWVEGAPKGPRGVFNGSKWMT